MNNYKTLDNWNVNLSSFLFYVEMISRFLDWTGSTFKVLVSVCNFQQNILLLKLLVIIIKMIIIIIVVIITAVIVIVITAVVIVIIIIIIIIIFIILWCTQIPIKENKEGVLAY